jgi:L-lactate dehydrogenase complex protein LldG
VEEAMTGGGSDHEVMDRVRAALGRRGTRMTSAPTPPPLPDEIVRLVRSDANLPEVFAQRAGELKMKVKSSSRDAAAGEVVAFFRQTPAKRIALANSALLEQLKVFDALASAGFETKRWDQLTLDELYDFAAAVTDVDCAVAETGTLVIKPTADHGRGLSLVPMYHVAVVERRQFLPDMIDLFERLNRDEQARSNVILISGPSKTADIEMNVVTGVHGPNVVLAVIVD